jgi:hypothetical protein
MRNRTTSIGLVVALAACCLIGAAGPSTKCARCGAVGPCKKMCRLVCEDKSVEVVCWGSKCEDFCVPGPGCPQCEHCKCVCQTCNEQKPSGVCSEPKRFYWKDWCPSFPQLYTKTKLMKRVETVKVPTYKWVVEDVCCNCACGCECGDVVATDIEPPTPKAQPTLK